MGAWLSKNFIEIANQSFDNGIITHIGYKDVTCELLDEIVNDLKIRVIQISKELPDEAFSVIDSILEMIHTKKCPKCGHQLEFFLKEDYMYFCKSCNTLFSEELNDELELSKE